MPIYNPRLGSVLLLHHFDGSLQPEVGEAFAADGGVAFVDTNARFGQSLSIGGVAAGVGSPSGGGSNVVYSATPSALYDLGEGDFTIEGWMWMNSASVRPRSLIRIADAANVTEYEIFFNEGTGMFRTGFPTGNVGSGDAWRSEALGGVATLNTWWHLAMTRSGNVYRSFVQGDLRWTWETAYRRPAGPKQVFIGNSRRGFVDALDGMVDEILIARECLYTDDFIPPEQPYTSAWPSGSHVWPAGASFK